MSHTTVVNLPDPPSDGGSGWLEQLASILASLATIVSAAAVPVLIAWALWTFRREIKEFLRNAEGFQFGDLKIHRDVKEARDAAKELAPVPDAELPPIGADLNITLDDATVVSDAVVTDLEPKPEPAPDKVGPNIEFWKMMSEFPSHGIVASFAKIEERISQLCELAGVLPVGDAAVQAHLLASRGFVEIGVFEVVTRLQRIRNQAAHYPEKVSLEDSESFHVSANLVLQVLDVTVAKLITPRSPATWG